MNPRRKRQNKKHFSKRPVMVAGNDEYQNVEHITEADDPQEAIEALDAQSELHVVEDDGQGDIVELD